MKRSGNLRPLPTPKVSCRSDQLKAIKDTLKCSKRGMVKGLAVIMVNNDGSTAWWVIGDKGDLILAMERAKSRILSAP